MSEAQKNQNSPDEPTVDLPPIDETDYTDHRRPLLRALNYGGKALVVVIILLLIIWGWIANTEGLIGVIMSAAISGAFILTTAGLVLASSNTSPATTGAIVLGGWLVKIVILIAILFVIRDLEFYNTWAFFTTTLATLVVVIGAEIWGVITTRTMTLGD
ncbi:integral membrane protein [Corynebacterium renale]|uniref:ATP synthase protein I n=1 Tax=Corynebacterium renale TaxID=1724 RepID=A0A2A9DRY0_9CORY|nr:hypothetical protein ATK06_2044 [Corynebacterium renale]SQI25569.1 integral membrane protein [Corynebacterium renale]